ncbi:MAG: serine hydrolase domain-containing protein [Candidatus Heimdallarchaeota archaeon]
MSKNKFSFLALLIITTISLFFISTSCVYGSTYRNYWPMEEWKTKSPFSQGLIPKNINSINDYIEIYNSNHFFSDVESVVIVKNGYIVKELYFKGWTENDFHVCWSVTKSVTSALIGIAVDEGLISLDDTVIDYFQNYTIANLDERKEAMTIENILVMSSGLNYLGDDVVFLTWVSSPDQVQYALDIPMATVPGTIFNYDTCASHLLSAIIERVTGNTTFEYAQEKLFGPLGITHVHWEHDKQGVFYGGNGLFLEPRDMAKFGYLFINNGYWDGLQIISEEWIDLTTSEYWSLWADWGYAYHWWTHADINGYAAHGKDGQAIFVIPEEDLVVAFTAEIIGVDPEPYLEIIHTYILQELFLKEFTLTFAILLPVSVAAIIVITILSIRFGRKRKIQNIDLE